MDLTILTEEQKEVMATAGNIRINAVAGSGKTATLLAYAKTRPAGKRILYVAFNRSVRLEAQQRFAEMGLPEVAVETAHSLAYRYVVPAHRYEVHPSGYTPYSLAELLGLRHDGTLQLQLGDEPHGLYMIAHHVWQLSVMFCHAKEAKVQDLDYLSTLQEEEQVKFATRHLASIQWWARQFLAKMNQGQCKVTHDFYLKKFQLQKPVLPYDYILLDEAQDSSPAVLDIFLRQPAVKVMVGDAHQQIYSWRYAVNAMEQADFPLYKLSTSFRFGASVAKLAQAVLQRKGEQVVIHGAGKSVGWGQRAVLARTNAGLLVKAIEYASSFEGKVYFEGHLQSYTYAADGASLYDILNLDQGKTEQIRDPLLRSMQSIKDLKEYIDKTGDVSLSMMLDLVEKYGSKLPMLIKQIKNMHVEKEERASAHIIFSTVHRAKGMEYDVVELADDFVADEEADGEEVNLLYVAITRAKKMLYIPEALIPEGTSIGSGIQVIKSVFAKFKEQTADNSANGKKGNGRNSRYFQRSFPNEIKSNTYLGNVSKNGRVRKTSDNDTKKRSKKGKDPEA